MTPSFMSQGTIDPPPLIVREAVRPADQKQIEALARVIIHEFYDPLLPREHNAHFIDAHLSVAAQTVHKTLGMQYYLLETQEDSAIGFAAWKRYPRELYLSKLYLLKEWRGKGYGQKAMQVILARGMQAGHSLVRLIVNPNNFRAIRFYERLGFVFQREVITHHENGIEIVDFEMLRHAFPLPKGELYFQTVQAEHLPFLLHWQKDKKANASAQRLLQRDWETYSFKQESWNRLLLVMYTRKPIGLIEIIDPQQEESHYWGIMPKDQRAINFYLAETTHRHAEFQAPLLHLALWQCFKEDGVNTVWSEPPTDDYAALQLFEHLGFKPVDERKVEGKIHQIFQIQRADWMPPADW